MIYDNKTLEKLSQEELKKHEEKLHAELKQYIEYWNNHSSDNEGWAWKVTTNTECLKQVRKYLVR
jgi:hypothetical protein